MTERKKPNNKRLILMIVLLAVVIALMWLLPDGSQPAAPATNAPKTEQTKNTNDAPDDIEATTLVKAGTQAPDFRVEMFDGTTFTLGSLRGKVVLLNFWATWCGPCKAAMRASEPVKKDFVGKDIVFLYLAGENSPKGTWEQMIPDIKGEHYRMTDAQWTYICNKFGVQGVPSYMIISKDGTPTHFQVGFMGADKMKEMLMKELDK